MGMYHKAAGWPDWSMVVWKNWTNMPELPEVETVARGLQRAVSGRRIIRVTLGETDFIDNPREVARELPGLKIRLVERYGKFLLLRLSAENLRNREETALLVHLGMTG